MARAVGIGGIFFKAQDPKALAAWYQAHLGIDVLDWGGAAFGQKIADAWLAFMDVAPRLAAIDTRKGGEAALAAYREMLSGQADPKQGIVVVP
mgnify:CR=1 FL=1